MKTYIKITLLIACVAVFSQCKKNLNVQPDGSALEVIDFPDGFDFSTSKVVDLELAAPGVLSKSIFDIWYKKRDLSQEVILRGTFNVNGIFQMKVALPAHVDSLFVSSISIGLEQLVSLPIVDNKASHNYAVYFNAAREDDFLYGTSNSKSTQLTQFSFMGSYTANGYPSYLHTVNDHAWESLLSNLNQTLPEGVSVPQTRPAFLESGKQSNLKLLSKTNVYVTFAGEGTDRTSALGYYIVNGSKPVNLQHIIIFPNASAPGSGGSLHSGDKVLLGEFPANTEIGWFLVPNGWNKQAKSVRDLESIYYSVPSYNPETDIAKKQHMVLLKDIQNEVIVLGFEDTPRSDANCDNDFNDAVFYITLDQLAAADLSNVSNTISPVDTDGDGIIDSLDQFPLDPDRAFNKGGGNSSSGSLAFEDLWPDQGDYDFNDLVVDYLFSPITDANNLIKQLDIRLTIKNIGGSFHNGFGFEFPIPASSVESVSGAQYFSEYLDIAANGVENNRTNAVIFPFDDGWSVNGQTFTVSIVFKTAVAPSSLGTYPYNPFLVVNGIRGREVHLPDYLPTEGVDPSFFGQGADYSRPSKGLYYRSSQNLPWAINVVGGYAVPVEKAPINYGYLKFVDWAKSAGAQFSDWNIDLTGYRNSNYLNN